MSNSVYQSVHTGAEIDEAISKIPNLEQQINSLDADVVAHEADDVSQGELHGLRINAEGVFQFFDGEVWVDIKKSLGLPMDTTGSPGSAYLLSGTMQEGFFGEVSSSQFITGDTLASECGISQGISQFSTEPWLKFAYKGEILFVAKKPIRHSISWDAINAAKCVYGDSGDKTVVIGGKTYKVTLMRALEPTNDPKTVASANSGTVNHYSEWNRLICQIHEEAINGSWSPSANVENDIGILKHNLGNGTQGMYSDTDLVFSNGSGRFTWCQEMGTATNTRLTRGIGGVAGSSVTSPTEIYFDYGWRPVLRLVEED